MLKMHPVLLTASSLYGLGILILSSMMFGTGKRIQFSSPCIYVAFIYSFMKKIDLDGLLGSILWAYNSEQKWHAMLFWSLKSRGMDKY